MKKQSCRYCEHGEERLNRFWKCKRRLEIFLFAGLLGQKSEKSWPEKCGQKLEKLRHQNFVVLENNPRECGVPLFLAVNSRNYGFITVISKTLTRFEGTILDKETRKNRIIGLDIGNKSLKMQMQFCRKKINSKICA